MEESEKKQPKKKVEKKVKKTRKLLIKPIQIGRKKYDVGSFVEVTKEGEEFLRTNKYIK